MAMGGISGGAVHPEFTTATATATREIDYVRVYQF